MRPGDQIGGRFEIRRLAGSGGMGEVFQAVDLGGGAPVAVKVLRGASAEDRARFEREAQAIAKISHPAVVRYIAEGRTALDEQYLVMEWLEGEDLASLLRRRRLGVDEALTLARSVADALADVHGRDMVHRDIKPSNLFLVGARIQDVRVLDFGIALLEGPRRMTRTGAVLGSPGYMAPEQARGEARVTPAADVFALGCVLFEALSGSPAFQGDNILALMAKVVFEVPPPLRVAAPYVPAPVAALIDRMLAKDPAARPRDGAALLEELDAIRGDDLGDPGAPAPDSAPASIGSKERRVFAVVLLGRSAEERTEATANGDATLASTLPTPVISRLRDLVAEANGWLSCLADGSLAIALGGAGVAKDRATLAARFALSMRALVGDRPIALATGSAESTGGAPLGAAIDRAARRLERARAARQDGAGPVAIDELTGALLDTRFELRDGADGPELLGERAYGETIRTLLGRPIRCVGRERELRQLEDAFAACVEEPAAGACLVTAAAGVGKSRLAHELLRAVRQRAEPVEVWVGHGDPMQIGSPLGLLGQALRHACGVLGGEPLEERREKLRARVARWAPPEDRKRIAEFAGEIVGAPFPDDGSPPLRAARRDAKLMAEQLQRAFEDLCRLACARGPTLIVFEDLHRSDAGTVRFVDAALRSARDLPLFVLALARPEVHARFPRLWAERGAQELRLPPLSRKACERLVREALQQGAGDETVERLVARADGNAFYLEELIRAAAGGRRELPETVVTMVQSRLEALEPGARRALRVASVFGEIFWRGGLAALSGGRASTRPEIDWVSALIEQEIFVRRKQSRFPGEEELAFRHALLREGAYSMLTDEDRALGHRLAGEWLEARGEPDALLLAEHFERGRQPEQAARHYLAAAVRAHRGGDTPAALERARRGLSCNPAGQRADLLGLICETHVWSNDAAGAADCAEEVTRLAPPGSVPWVQGSIAKLVIALLRNEPAELLSVLNLLADVEPSAEASDSVLHALVTGACFLDLAGSLSASDRITERMHVILEHHGADEPMLRAWIGTIHAMRDPIARQDPWSGLQEGRIAMRLCQELGYHRLTGAARALSGMNLWLLGALEEARRELEEAAATRLELGPLSSFPLFCLAAALTDLGALDDARREAERLIEVARAVKAPLEEGRGRWALASALLRAGDLEAAEREALAARGLLGAVPLDRPGVLATVAAVQLARGRAEEALAGAEQAARYEQDQGASGFARGAFIRLTHAECLAAAGRAGDARRVLEAARDRLLAQAEKIGDPGPRRTFFEGVPENARTLALAREWL